MRTNDMNVRPKGFVCWPTQLQPPPLPRCLFFLCRLLAWVFHSPQCFPPVSRQCNDPPAWPIVELAGDFHRRS
jgi:hypothetical protein